MPEILRILSCKIGISLQIFLINSCVTAAPAAYFDPLAGTGKVPNPTTEHQAIKPTDRLTEPLWKEFIDRTKGEIVANPDASVLLLGDSITQGWRKHPAIWDKYLGDVTYINAGIWSDGTQHLLWRLKNGTVNGLHPKVIVLLIGTNNGLNTAEEISEGIYLNVAEVSKIYPECKLLLLGIFPSGKDPAGKRRLRNMQVNSQIAEYANGKNIFFLDFNQEFLGPNNEIPEDTMPDALHLTAKGYEIWAKNMAPALRFLLTETPGTAGH